jgi:sec-independent protein translocase protein TatA
LIFFGSKSIPGIARTLGKTMRQIKDASNELQSEIKKSGVDIKKDLNLDGLNLDSLVRDTANEIQRPLDQYVSDLDNAVQFEKPKQKPTINVAPNQNPTEKPNDAIENKTSDQSIPPVTNRQETAN